MVETETSLRPRGRPRSFDRGEALDVAMRLFWSRGYEATSISDLTAAMRIAPPALYGAFGDKKRLFLEALQRYEDVEGCFAQKALTQEPTAERAMRRLLLDAVKFFTEPDNPKGCMMVSSATNCTSQSDDIYEAVAQRRRAAERGVRARIAAGRDAGELSDDADVDVLAGVVMATLYGLAMKARDGASRAMLRKLVERAMMMWPHPRRREAGRAETAAIA